MKRHLDDLGDGMEQLGIYHSELTAESIKAVEDACRVRDAELSQLRAAEALSGLEADDAAVTTHLADDRPWREIRPLEEPLARIRERYVEERRALINRQHAAMETVRARIKTRPGFEKLGADASHRVLRPIAEAMVDTTADAVAPTLTELRDRFAARIASAEETANDRLDEELNQKPESQVVKVELHLRGREVASRDQLGALLHEIEERVGPQLDQGKRVRIG